MRYFSRVRYLALQNPDESAVHAADADWEQAVDRYEAYLETIRPGLSESARQLLDGFHLHDARVLSMGRNGDRFTISLQLDVPPRELLTLTYELVGEPEVRKELFPWAKESSALAWLYDELSSGEGGGQHLVHSILLSNGWELDLPFRDVQLVTAYPMFPNPAVGGQAAKPAITSSSG
jgi:hypothetical protein